MIQKNFLNSVKFSLVLTLSNLLCLVYVLPLRSATEQQTSASPSSDTPRRDSDWWTSPLQSRPHWQNSRRGSKKRNEAKMSYNCQTIGFQGFDIYPLKCCHSDVIWFSDMKSWIKFKSVTNKLIYWYFVEVGNHGLLFLELLSQLKTRRKKLFG